MSKKQGELINLSEKVEVIATATNPYREAGTKAMVHPNVAKKGRRIGHYEPAKKGKE